MDVTGMDFTGNPAIRSYFEQATVAEVLDRVIASVEMRAMLIRELSTPADTETATTHCMFDDQPDLHEESVAHRLYTDYYLQGQGDRKIMEILSEADFEQLLREYDVRSWDRVEMPSGLQPIVVEEIYQAVLRKWNWEEEQYQQIFGTQTLNRIRDYGLDLIVIKNGLRYHVNPIWKRGPITVQIGNTKTDYASLEDFSRQVLLRKYIKVNLTAMDGCCHDAKQWSIEDCGKILKITTTVKTIGKIKIPDRERYQEIPSDVLAQLQAVDVQSHPGGSEILLDDELTFELNRSPWIYPLGWDHYNDNLEYLKEPSPILDYYYKQEHLPKMTPSSTAIKTLKRIASLLRHTVGNFCDWQPVNLPFLIQSLISLPPICIEKYRGLLENPALLTELESSNAPHFNHWLCRILVGELGYKLYDFDGQRIRVSSSYSNITVEQSEIALPREMESPPVDRSPIDLPELPIKEQLNRIHALFKQYFEIYDEPRAIPYGRAISDRPTGRDSISLGKASTPLEQLFVYPQKIAQQDVIYLARLLAMLPNEYLEKYGPLLILSNLLFDSSSDLTVTEVVQILIRTPDLIGSSKNTTRDDILKEYGITIQGPESWVLYLRYQDQWITSTAALMRTELYRFLAEIFRQELNVTHLDILTREPCIGMSPLRPSLRSSLR